ncbi:MAG: M4 family metallopeptidase [Bacteroidales bacterium]|nr:M4 family metallopeptidase [Bacteroidales bacterium]
MARIRKILLAVFLLCNISAIGQVSIKDYEHDENWYVLPEDSKYSLNNFVEFYKNSFSLSRYDSFVIDTMDLDKQLIDSNIAVYKLKHYFNNIEVENSQMIVFSKAGNVQFAYGEVFDNIANYIDVKATTISKTISQESALKNVGENFAWQDTNLENYIKELTEDSTATFYPSLPNQKIRKINGIPYLLDEWGITTYDTINGLQTVLVYVDKYNGQIVDRLIKQNNLIDNCNDEGEVITLYYGRKYDMETYRGFPWLYYKLRNCDKIYTTRGRSTTPLTDSDNVWTSVEERPTTTAHWAVCKAQDYFKNSFGANIRHNLQINAGLEDVIGAEFRPYILGFRPFNEINIGKYNGNYCSTVDIIAHEYAHCLISYSSNLVYQGESGALNESFADIFANLAERSILGRNNWEMGEDVGIVMRDLSNPECSYYEGENWINLNGIADTIGMYTNSGVQSKWFQLIFDEIGLDNARKLVKWTERFLNPTSKYRDSKNISIHLSQLLFEKCSDEYKAVVDAWNEVGVSAFDSDFYCKNAFHIMPNFLASPKMESKRCEMNNIYPNPTRDFVNIELQEDSLVEIIDINGKIVKSLELSAGVNKVDVSDLPNGVYNIKTQESVSRLVITK